jgi:precorrin-6B methylase 2
VDRLALGRLLAALTAAGLLREPEPGSYALTPVTELLRSDVPNSVRMTAVMYGEEVFQSFADLLGTVQTGRPAFNERHGIGFYEYLGHHPEAAETFHAAMSGQPVPAVLRRADLGHTGTLVDIGGGNGRVLAAVLRDRPGLSGILLERPEATDLARRELAAAGLQSRADVVAGDCFGPDLPRGDRYLLCRVLHNWTDRDAVTILRRIVAILPPSGRLVVVEGLLPDGARAVGGGRSAAQTRMVDLLMLVTMEGRDRTEAEHRDLLAQAGLRVVRVLREDGEVEAAIEAASTVTSGP